MAGRKPLRVLLVEDSMDDELLILLELRSDYRVIHERVETADDLRFALTRKSWDVVLSDYNLPKFSAPAALAIVRGMSLDIPFIIVSGAVGEDVAVEGMKSGANDYVPKNNLRRLCAAIERETREAALRSDQKRIQEQLLIADRMASMGTLAAGVAHEINNPLAAIIANLELAERELADLAQELNLEERFNEVLEELHDARDGANRVREIVRDLKIFSRSSEEERRGPVNVQMVLDSSLRMAWNEIRHRATLVKDYRPVPEVAANEARLGQVFLNLIVNAAHAIREGDVQHNEIRVSTRMATAGRVLVTISDTGAGIPAENLPRIFDAFFTTKPIGVGTGLGLSICHRIITGLGGEIFVMSEPGKGASFKVLLPAADELDAPRKRRASVQMPIVRRGSVLVVDDDATILRTVMRILENEHEVVATESAREALEFLKSGAYFDVILCDLMMPQMTGMEFHAALARELPAQLERLIFCTGGAFTPGAQEFLETIDTEMIDKPFDPKELRALVNARIK
jgi:signal transduction histidine kinase